MYLVLLKDEDGLRWCIMKRNIRTPDNQPWMFSYPLSRPVNRDPSLQVHILTLQTCDLSLQIHTLALQFCALHSCEPFQHTGQLCLKHG